MGSPERRAGGTRRRPAAWEQTPGERFLEYFWVFLPFVLLALPTVLTLVMEDEPVGSKLLTVAVAAVAAGVYAVLLLRYELEPATPLLLLYYVAQLGLLWLLLARSPWYAFTYFAMIFQAFVLPGAWAVLGVTATVLTAYTSGSVVIGSGGDQSTGGTIVSLAGNIGFTLMLGLLIRTSLDQGDRRRLALEEVSKAHERLETTLAENAALQRQLLTQAREAGVLDERARLAREIHDTIAQGLTGIVTQLEATEKALEGNPDAQRHLDSARRLARDSLSEARRSVEALRPEPLEAARLPDALADVVARWTETNEVKADITTTGAVVPMHPEVEVTLLRVAQEALTNVAKHASAGRVGLTLSYMDDQLTLDVRDDGAGFDLDALPTDGRRPDGGGFGLTAMRQRLTRLAGTLEVESAPGQGTAISASVPAVPAGGLSTGAAPTDER